MSKNVRVKDLYDCNISYLSKYFSTFEFPWEMLKGIGELAKRLTEEGIEGFTKLNDKVLIGKNVKIASTAVIEGYCVIGDNSEVRPGAYLRGNVITGADCVLGNSSEFKNCILLNHVQCPHYNYVGDSILGNYTHTGAGTICSNLKSDNRPVVIHSDTDYVTGIRKIGAFLGDYADVGCQCVLNPGTIICNHSRVYPLTCVRGVIGSNMIVKSMDNIVEIKENI